MKMSEDRNLVVASAFAIVGGALILVSSILWVILSTLYGSFGWLPVWGCPCGMMWRWGGSMMAWPFGGMMILTSIIAVVSGVVLIIGGLMIRSNPKDASLWGSIILVFSVIGFLGGGGFIIGSLIGLIGGILAISSSQSAKS